MICSDKIAKPQKSISWFLWSMLQSMTRPVSRMMNMGWHSKKTPLGEMSAKPRTSWKQGPATPILMQTLCIVVWFPGEQADRPLPTLAPVVFGAELCYSRTQCCDITVCSFPDPTNCLISQTWDYWPPIKKELLSARYERELGWLLGCTVNLTQNNCFLLILFMITDLNKITYFSVAFMCVYH